MAIGKYGLDPSKAAAVNSLVFLVSAAVSPLIGCVVNCVGYSLIWILSGIALTSICHGIFAFAPTCSAPAVLMGCLGLSYSILASNLWPLIGIVLPEHQRATAYGLVQSVQNLGLGLISILAGYIVDSKVSSVSNPF